MRRLRARGVCRSDLDLERSDSDLSRLIKGRNVDLFYFLEVYKALCEGIFQHFQK